MPADRAICAVLLRRRCRSSAPICGAPPRSRRSKAAPPRTPVVPPTDVHAGALPDGRSADVANRPNTGAYHERRPDNSWRSRRLRVAQLRRARWAASRRSGLRHLRTSLLLPIWPPPAGRYRARHGFEREHHAGRGPRRIPSPISIRCPKIVGARIPTGRPHDQSTSAWRPFLPVRASASLSLAIISTKSGLWYRLFADRLAQYAALSWTSHT
jgi:hypothetical protein